LPLFYFFFFLFSVPVFSLAVLPVKLTAVANQPGFPGCQPTDMPDYVTSTESFTGDRQRRKTPLFTEFY